MTTITINGKTYNLVSLPSSPQPASIELTMTDSVAVVRSPFTGIEQTQRWAGAEQWGMTITYPPMPDSQSRPLEGALAGLRGKANVFQMGDPRAKKPLGVGSGVPVVNSSDPSFNLPMTTTLKTRGWTANTFRILLPGDYMQVGYRLYRVCERVNSDGSGNADITIWPSLREQPADATPIVLHNAVGLFRLANNKITVNYSPTQLTTLSIQCVEAR